MDPHYGEENRHFTVANSLYSIAVLLELEGSGEARVAEKCLSALQWVDSAPPHTSING